MSDSEDADYMRGDKRGVTPLHSACKNGHVNIVNLILENRLYDNHKTNTNETPLFMASWSDINVTDVDG